MKNFDKKQKATSLEDANIEHLELLGFEVPDFKSWVTYEFAEKHLLPQLATALEEIGLKVYGTCSGSHFVCDSDEENEILSDDSVSLILGVEGKDANSFTEFQDKSFVHGLCSKNSSLVDRIIGHLQIETVEGGQ